MGQLRAKRAGAACLPPRLARMAARQLRSRALVGTQVPLVPAMPGDASLKRTVAPRVAPSSPVDASAPSAPGMGGAPTAAEPPEPPARGSEPPAPVSVRRGDDKENIAPIRQVTPAILAQEAEDTQRWDSIALRTRRRRAEARAALTAHDDTRERERAPVQVCPPMPPSMDSSTAPVTPRKRAPATPPATQRRDEKRGRPSHDTTAPPTPVPAAAAPLPSPPVTPSKPAPAAALNVYAEARAALRHGPVLGRAPERAALHAFLDACTQGSDASGCLYVSGMPGTGKTVLVQDVVQSRADAAVLYINCVSLTHPAQIEAQWAAALGADSLEAARSWARPLVVVLDELDLLLQTPAHHALLHRVFCWPRKLREHGAVALIGIANSLDLTERFVPVLKSQGVPPTLLYFAPLSPDALVALLGARLPSASLVSAPALQLLARKLCASTGDVRRALDACRQALELAEADAARVGGTPPVSPTHVLKVLAHLSGQASMERVRALGVHAKLLLLAWVVLQQRAEAANAATMDGGVSLHHLELAYADMLQRDAAFVAPLRGPELVDVLERLEVQGLVRVDVPQGKSTSPTPRSRGGTPATPRLSPSAKRAAARQQLATNRRVAPTLDRESIVRALTTGAVAGAESAHTPTVVDAMRRLLRQEDDELARKTVWRNAEAERARTRREELGGGRDAAAFMY